MNQRLLLTVVGIALVSVFVVSAAQSGWHGASGSFFAAACGRIGLVALAAALAWPQLIPLVRRFPVWVWGIFGVAGLIVLVRPKLFLVAFALAAAAVAIQSALRFLHRNLR